MQVEEVLLNSEPYRGASERGAALGLLAAFKLLNGHSGARARQVAAIWCRKKWSRFAVRCLTFAMQNDPLPFSAPLNPSQMESSRPTAPSGLCRVLTFFELASAGDRVQRH